MQYKRFSPMGKGANTITDAEDTASTAGNSSDGTCSEAEDNQFIPSRPVSPNAERALQTCIEEDIKKWSHSVQRPALSYARLVAMAIHASPVGRCTVTEIYAYIEQTFKFYREQGSQYWKVRQPYTFRLVLPRSLVPNLASNRGPCHKLVGLFSYCCTAL